MVAATYLGRAVCDAADRWNTAGWPRRRTSDGRVTMFMFGDAAFADVVGDGDQDLAFTGELGNGQFRAQILSNEGVGAGGVFAATATILPDIPVMRYSSIKTAAITITPPGKVSNIFDIPLFFLFYFLSNCFSGT